MEQAFRNIVLRVAAKRFEGFEQFVRETPEYSIGLEVVDGAPGHWGHHVHFDHHAEVVREATMSAAMQAYIAVRQGRLMERWLRRQRPVPVYVWNADQDVCLAAFVLEYHELLERSEGAPLLRWIVQYNNKIDVCGGLYPVNLNELVENHFTWVFEPYRQQRMRGKTQGDDALVEDTIWQVCSRLRDLLEGKAGTAPITANPEILYKSPYNFVIADEKGDPNSRLVLAAQGHTNLISLVCQRSSGRFTYSVIRGSPYDEDVFQVPKLIEAFQAAENSPGVKIWGGSNLAAGSDSEFGSSLSWMALRDIAEPIVRDAFLASTHGQPLPEAQLTRPVALAAIPPGQTTTLPERLSAAGLEVSVVTSCEEARKILRMQYQTAAVFTAPTLPDGAFRDLIQMARERAHPAPVVVCVPRLDASSVDALEAGAFEVLAEDSSPERIAQVVEAVLGCGKRGVVAGR
jgi:hypothetical protein